MREIDSDFSKSPVSPEPMVLKQAKSTLVGEPTLLCDHKCGRIESNALQVFP